MNERWLLQFDANPDAVPVEQRIRTLLKFADQLNLRCKGYRESEEITRLRAEVARLQEIVESLSARVAGQSELLSRKGERA